MSQWFDTGFFRVLVPEGWMAFYGIDSDGKATAKKLHIYKDAHSEMDIFTKAGITVCYYTEDEIYISPRDFYDDTADIPPLRLGAHHWTGYTCTSFGYPYTMLETVCHRYTLQVMILMKNGTHEISLKDEAVKTILESLVQAIQQKP